MSSSASTSSLPPPSSSTSSIDYNQDLTVLLRQHTSKQHATSGKLIHLFAPFALSSPRIYRMLLSSFYHIYKALEEELESRRFQFPKITPIYFRELLRTSSFEKDLSYYYKEEAQAQAQAQAQNSNSATSPIMDSKEIFPPPSAATQAYIQEMRSAISEEPILLIAYCYTLYMALMAGGFIIKRWIVNAFHLTPPQGVEIFDFSSTIKDMSKFKQMYKDSVNSLSLAQVQKARIVQQKKRVFECNNEILKEVCLSPVNRRRMFNITVKTILAIVFLICCWWIFSSVFLSSDQDHTQDSTTSGYVTNI